MSETLELDLWLPAPEVTPQEIEQLVAVLTAGLPDEAGRLKSKGWMTAAQIAARMEGITERHIRKVASAAAPGIVSFPGSRGYKLWELCTVEEINHAIESFEAQANDMIRRAHMYRRAYHGRFRGGGH